MSELIPLDMSQLPSTTLASDEDFAGLAKGGDFLGRLQLFTKGSFVNKRLVQPGEFGIPSGEKVEVIGDSVDCIALARRGKAIDMSDKNNVIETFDVNSDTFKDIAERSGGKDSGCMYGVSFLVYERTLNRFLEFYCGTKSSRPEAGNIFPYLPLSQADIDAKAAAGQDVTGLEPHGPLAFTMTSRLLEKKGFSWHVPVVTKCSTPFKRVPKGEEVLEQIRRFVEKKGSDVETAPESNGKKRAR